MGTREIRIATLTLATLTPNTLVDIFTMRTGLNCRRRLLYEAIWPPQLQLHHRADGVVRPPCKCQSSCNFKVHYIRVWIYYTQSVMMIYNVLTIVKSEKKYYDTIQFVYKCFRIN